MRVILVALLPCVLAAQVTSSALSGIVQDTAGAVVPSAKVTLTGEENGFVRTVNTTHEGFFSFPDLTPATFTLSVESKGFKTYKQTGILINSNEQRSVGPIVLSLGSVSETVTVTAEAVAVNLSSGEQSGTLTGNQLDEVALRGRDVFDAVSLMAGVVDTSDGRDAPSAGSISNIYIMGGRNDQKNMTVDGVTNLITGSNTSVNSMPSMDSVSEVKVMMAAYSAENGRNPSSINVITKGGTTSFHGGVAYYFRNEDLNANDFFANEAGQAKAKYRYNIGNYSIGGPVIVPHLHQIRNRLFFFFNQEWQRQLQNYGVKEVTVPTAAERQGDFSKSYNTGGVPGSEHVNDPLNNKAQFPGNIIPASRLTAIGQAIVNMFPVPNFTDPNPTNRYQWNYYANVSEPYPRRTDTIRIDYSPRDNWQLYVSLNNTADTISMPYNATSYGWIAGSLNYPITPIQMVHPGKIGSLHSTNTITPSLFNEFSFGSAHNVEIFGPEDAALVDRTKLGINIPQRNPALNPTNIIPNMSFSGIQNYANPSMDNPTPYMNQENIFSGFDNVSWIHGKHTTKIGVFYDHVQKLQSAGASTRGSISFNQDGNNQYDANDAWGTALLGYYDNYGESTGLPEGNYNYSDLEWFVQDNWHVTRNLTFDYGVRFYHDEPEFDSRHQLSSFDPQSYSVANAPVMLRPVKVNGTNYAQDPVTGTLYNNGLVGSFAPGEGNPSDGMIVGGVNGVPNGLYSPAPVSVAPRFGFAWDPKGDGRTAIRGGAGIYYDRLEGNPAMNLLGPPAFYTPTQYYGSISDIATQAGSGFLAPTGTIYSFLKDKGHTQQVYNFNLQIQRQISRSDVFSVGYTGSLGRHLLWQRNINGVPPGAQFLTVNPQNANPQSSSALPTNFLRPYQGWGDINMYEFANNSNYHALQAAFQHRLARGFNLAANYTFSKVLDCSDAYNSAVDPFLDIHSRDYGPAGFDRKHVFSANFYWNLPKPGKALNIRALGWIADNWSLSGVARMMTGGPTTPGYSLVNGISTPTGTASDGARLEVTNPNAPIPQRFGPPPEPAKQANVPWAIDSNEPQFGNLGRNTLYGPGTNNWDLSMYRNIRFIHERANAQIRLESYNTFNHTQWSAINTTAQFDSTGKMVSTAFDTPSSARPPRRLQIALRVTF